MANVRAKRSVEQVTQEKVKAGKCLVCGKEQNGKRGLCNAHYLAFRRQLQAQPLANRPDFEQHHIREGRILPVGQLHEIRSPNPFSSVG